MLGGTTISSREELEYQEEQPLRLFLVIALVLSDRLRDLVDRFMSCPLRAISERSGLEVGLEDRRQYQLERTLHHPVPDRGQGWLVMEAGPTGSPLVLWFASRAANRSCAVAIRPAFAPRKIPLSFERVAWFAPVAAAFA